LSKTEKWDLSVTILVLAFISELSILDCITCSDLDGFFVVVILVDIK